MHCIPDLWIQTNEEILTGVQINCLPVPQNFRIFQAQAFPNNELLIQARDSSLGFSILLQLSTLYWNRGKYVPRRHTRPSQAFVLIKSNQARLVPQAVVSLLTVLHMSNGSQFGSTPSFISICIWRFYGRSDSLPVEIEKQCDCKPLDKRRLLPSLLFLLFFVELFHSHDWLRRTLYILWFWASPSRSCQHSSILRTYSLHDRDEWYAKRRPVVFIVHDSKGSDVLILSYPY